MQGHIINFLFPWKSHSQSRSGEPVPQVVFSELTTRCQSFQGSGEVCYKCINGLNHAVTQEGLFTENKEKLINGVLNALLREGDQTTLPNVELEG